MEPTGTVSFTLDSLIVVSHFYCTNTAPIRDALHVFRVSIHPAPYSDKDHGVVQQAKGGINADLVEKGALNCQRKGIKRSHHLCNVFVIAAKYAVNYYFTRRSGDIAENILFKRKFTFVQKRAFLGILKVRFIPFINRMSSLKILEYL